MTEQEAKTGFLDVMRADYDVKYGFSDDVKSVHNTGKGLSEDVVREIRRIHVWSSIVASKITSVAICLFLASSYSRAETNWG